MQTRTRSRRLFWKRRSRNVIQNQTLLANNKIENWIVNETEHANAHADENVNDYEHANGNINEPGHVNEHVDENEHAHDSVHGNHYAIRNVDDNKTKPRMVTVTSLATETNTQTNT